MLNFEALQLQHGLIIDFLELALVFPLNIFLHLQNIFIVIVVLGELRIALELVLGHAARLGRARLVAAEVWLRILPCAMTLLFQIFGLLVEVPVIWVREGRHVKSVAWTAVCLSAMVMRLLKSHLSLVVVFGLSFLLYGHLQGRLLEFILIDRLGHVVGVNTWHHVWSRCVNMFFMLILLLEIVAAVVFIREAGRLRVMSLSARVARFSLGFKLLLLRVPMRCMAMKVLLVLMIILTP